MNVEAVKSYHQERLADWVGLLKQIVSLESPTFDKAAVDRLAAFLKAQLESVGARVEVLPQAEYGDFLRAEFGPAEAAGQVLVLCHIDTVWPLGQIESMPLVEREGKLYGPGIFDMKGGVMYTIAALHAIRDLGLRLNRKIVLLYTSEEEIGSPVSRAVIEAEAKRSDLALVLEPSVSPSGAIKTSRSGVGMYEIRVEGRPSHAGGNPRAGISAVEEMARQTLALHGLTDYEKGTTVNVGVVHGGTRRNVVAAEAVAEIDLRVTTMAEAERADRAIKGLKPFHPEAKVTVTGGLNRPPMERTAAIVALYGQARSLAAGLGFSLAESHSGGGSDGNFTAAIGTPTLDGLGAVGDGAHAFHEHIQVDTIAERVSVLTLLLAGE